ncbi:MAG: c-type cytochrome biogenesis protein CcmI [Zoogloea sp.]|uniref:c-type cytochrome biogenesis protein CcmI n=1 Tax=Zoogloea sp. TaxID=49181 RepID=UPI002613B08C|nr:c-type cytochrome biogenesis protein CcmI [Zoogloea sp.]MDD3328663.1 c-type cytochrome biogenesis protein CcmI [Zoogloea sp.]
MTAFWISSGLLTLLVLAVLCWPLLRRHGGAGASRKAINTAIYRDQLAELERDLASGVLSQADYGSARDELERRVLEDVAADATTAAPASPRRLPRTALALAVTLPLAAVVLYVVLGTPAALDPAAREGQQASAAEIEKMVDALAAKLEKDPGNLEGWAMLGRSYMVTGRFADAAKAFDKAGAAMEASSEMMLQVAELSAELNQGRVEGRGRELLQRVLKAEPQNPQALVLAGTDAFFRSNFADAVRHWEAVLAMLPPDSPDARNLAAGIEKARSQLGADKASAKPKAGAEATAGKAVSGRVELAPALKAKASPDDVVFIFARAAEGPRMPLAVVRTRVADLPRDFTLDDSMALSPELKLSSSGSLRIEARVSKSGDAAARPGDLRGESGPVQPGARKLGIVIDKVVE